MTTFMTFSVYSLRIASDMPVESNFVPMVTLYFVLGISYTFLSLVWFIIANHFIAKNALPNFLTEFASFLKRILFWKYDAQPLWRHTKAKVDLAEIKDVDNLDNSAENPSDKKNENMTSTEKSTCFTCDQCFECRKDKANEREKAKNREITEKDISVLNHFMCFVMFLIILACNLITWLMISYPPATY